MSTKKFIIKTYSIWQTTHDQPNGNTMVMTSLGKVFNIGFFSCHITIRNAIKFQSNTMSYKTHF